MTVKAMTAWLDILRQAVVDHGSVAAVSRILCGSGSLRPALSLAINGRYFGDAARLEKLVRDRFERVDCPYLKATLPIADCRAIWSGPTPTHDPAQLAHRRACRNCERKETNHA